MNSAKIFDMISRTVGEPLPNCSFIRKNQVEFYGTEDELSNMPLRLDFIVENCNQTILVGDAKQVELRKNCDGYIATYQAYAVHTFETAIPT